MVGVDQIGEMRRACFEHGRPIQSIVRTLSVSRVTVRNVVLGPLDWRKFPGYVVWSGMSRCRCRAGASLDPKSACDT